MTYPRAIAVITCLGATQAQAAIVSFGGSERTTTFVSPRTVEIEQFDPGLGRLDYVFFEISGFAYSAALAEPDFGAPAVLDVGVAGEIEFVGFRADDGNFTMQDEGNCDDSDGCFIFADLINGPFLNEDLSVFRGDDLSAFVEAGTPAATFTTDAQKIYGSEYSNIYDYTPTPVPLPAGLPLMGAGSGTLGLVRHAKSRGAA